MKILIVSNLYPPRVVGGYELGCQKFAEELRLRGHDVRVLTSPCAERTDDDQSYVERTLAIDAYTPAYDEAPAGPVAELKRHEAMVSQWANTLLFLDIVRRFRPDQLVFFNLIGVGGLAIVDAADRLGLPWTFALGDAVPASLVAGIPADELALFGAPQVFARGRHAAITQHLVDEIERAGIDLGDRVKIVPIGVSPVFVRDRSRAYRADGRTRFVFAGQLRAEKGLDLVLDAVAILTAETDAEFHVDLYGIGNVEPWLARARELGIESRVAYGGMATHVELAEVFSSSDALLLPTWPREPLALVAFEAASSGCVPIVTATSGAAERLVDGVHAIKIERSAPSLAQAMMRVVDGEVDLAELGRRGRRLGEGDMSQAAWIERLERLVTSDGGSQSSMTLDDPAVAAAAMARHEQAVALLYGRLNME